MNSDDEFIAYIATNKIANKKLSLRTVCIRFYSSSGISLFHTLFIIKGCASTL